MRVSDLQITQDGEAVLSARVDAPRLGWRGERLWFRLPAALAPREPHGDPFAVALLLPAMAAGHHLFIDGRLSPGLAANLARVQSLLLELNPVNPWTRFRRISVHARTFASPVSDARRTGLFFSGGVDSMYSLLRAEEETGQGPDALVFVHGFDIPLHDEARADTVLRHVRGAARMAGRELVVMRTNLRRFTDLALHWDMAHGAGLGAAGHALAGSFDRWLISASDSHYRDGELSGTTTPLDPLWSSERVTFVSVGGRSDRQRKAEVLATAPCAHHHLVVCWKAPAGTVNCGRCAKCLRTMLQFLVIDALPRFQTLPHAVDPDLISADSMPAEPSRIVHWVAMVERLSARPEWAPLAGRIRQLIDRSERIKHPPRPRDLVTREGRRLAAWWARRWLQRRLPVQVRRRLLPAYRRLRTGR